MKRTQMISPRTLVLVATLLAGLALVGPAAWNVAQGQGNPNPRIAPPDSAPYGKSLGQWGAEWWKWVFGIPADENPLLDTSGEFASEGQSGPVWFVAGNFGGQTERTVTVPAGKSLFFPLVNSVFWAPNDLELAAFIADEYYGLDPDDLTEEQLIRLAANFQIGPDAELTLTIDGARQRDLLSYYGQSRAFRIADTDLLDDLEVPIAEDNLSVAAGYWIMLAPLPVGEHTIRFTGSVDNPLFGLFELDVNYHITVRPR